MSRIRTTEQAATARMLAQDRMLREADPVNAMPFSKGMVHLFKQALGEHDAEKDQFEQDLRRVTTTEEERIDLRRLTILAGQIGLRSEQLEPMARFWFTEGRLK